MFEIYRIHRSVDKDGDEVTYVRLRSVDESARKYDVPYYAMRVFDERLGRPVWSAKVDPAPWRKADDASAANFEQRYQEFISKNRFDE